MEIKTSMTTCTNGHPFDTLRSRVCPVCGAPAAGVGGFVPTEAPGGSGGNFSATEAPGGSGGNFGATEAPGGLSGNFSATEIPHAYAPPVVNGSMGSTMPPDSGGRTNPFSVETMIGGDLPGGAQKNLEPVVGWLVCIEGPMRGRDLRIHAGYNSIGRESGDIRIEGDPLISRRNDARIAFDPGELRCFIAPDAGRNIIRVNGRTALGPVELNSYDVISIGNTKLMFVALCGERFSWYSQEGANG